MKKSAADRFSGEPDLLHLRNLHVGRAAVFDASIAISTRAPGVPMTEFQAPRRASEISRPDLAMPSGVEAEALLTLDACTRWAPGRSGGLAATAAIVMEPYLWPSPDAVQTINTLFDLPAHGREQDWEIELADGTRLGEFLAVLSQRTLDVDCRSALALLVLHSFTYADAAEPVAEMAVLARGIIHADTEVHQRMLSHWSEGFLEHEGWVRSILR